MAEKNFQDYADLGTAPDAGDFMLFRDVSDLTDSPDGTLKEGTVANLRAAVVPIAPADIATITASKLLGRGDSGAGVAQEITLGAGLTMTGTTLTAAGAGLPTDDTNPLVQDPVDTSRRTRIDTGAVATATVRAIIMPDQDVDLAPTTGTFLGSGNNLVTNARLADMAQATFKGRQAGAGTGDPEDLTAAQAKTALAITTADITGDLPLGQIADIASPTVLANVSGASAAPSAVAPAAFKTGFLFGTLADKNFVTVSDVSAGGTPSSTTFLRGDGTWASLIASVSYDVLDIDDATTLTAAHLRYQTTGGAIQVLKLRLRHSTTQTLPVRVTVADTDAVTGIGAEFDFIQADDQTGLCVLRAQTSGSINGKSFATTNVASSAWTNASGADVDISNLPAGATAEGDIFEVRNHATADNNGFYRNKAGGATCTKLSGNNPANAAAEAVDFDTGFIALGGPRATAVLIVDANAGSAPNTRLEGETNETRTVPGRTIFQHKLEAAHVLAVTGTATFSQSITLSGSGTIIGGDKVASALELKDIAETYVDAGNKSGAVSFDFSAGPWQKCVATANISSVAFTNPPATGRTGTITLEIHQDGTGGRTIAWGAAFRFPGGTDFTLSTAASAIDVFTFTTRDGGTTWYGFEGGKAFAA